jgi:ABC-type uncharacterized transport system permease subunit
MLDIQKHFTWFLNDFVFYVYLNLIVKRIFKSKTHTIMMDDIVEDDKLIIRLMKNLNNIYHITFLKVKNYLYHHFIKYN